MLAWEFLRHWPVFNKNLAYKAVVKTILAFLFLFPMLALSGERCNTVHVLEAMEINRERRELYKVDGNKDAAKIISRLILLEKVMLPFSAKLDRMVKKLHRANVPIWCEDLVSMNEVPNYQSSVPVPAQSFIAFEENKLKRLKKMMRKFEFSKRLELYDEIHNIILNDMNDPSYHCLTRHFLEAAARSLMLSDKHLESAPDDLKDDVRKAVTKLMRQLSYSLNFSTALDRAAAPIQSKGIPVLCQEMPPIPWLK